MIIKDVQALMINAFLLVILIIMPI